MTKEIWKPVVGFEQFYVVNSSGKVLVLPRNVDVYSKKLNKKWVRKINKRILTPYKPKNGKGYYYHNLRVNGRTTRKHVHHMVLESFVGLRPNNAVCNHKDGNTTNNHYSNLEWVTQSENCFHAYNIGLRKNNVPIMAEKHGAATVFNSISEAQRCLGLPKSITKNTNRIKKESWYVCGEYLLKRI